MKFTEQLSERIEGLRQDRQLSIAELSRRSGVTRRTISRLVRGEKVKEVRIVTIMRLCRGFEMSLTEFFDYEWVKE